MEAKDTVMSGKEQEKFITRAWRDRRGLSTQEWLKAQAEITWSKAIKEVVERGEILGNGSFVRIDIPIEILKEWGIDG